MGLRKNDETEHENQHALFPFILIMFDSSNPFNQDVLTWIKCQQMLLFSQFSLFIWCLFLQVLCFLVFFLSFFLCLFLLIPSLSFLISFVTSFSFPFFKQFIHLMFSTCCLSLLFLFFFSFFILSSFLFSFVSLFVFPSLSSSSSCLFSSLCFLLSLVPSLVLCVCLSSFSSSCPCFINTHHSCDCLNFLCFKQSKTKSFCLSRHPW